MAQEYELISFEKSDFKVGQNYWCTGAFLGISEPVKIVTPSPDKWVIGQKYYGEVKQETSKAGNSYNRFHRLTRPDAPPTTTPSSSSTTNRPPYKDNSDGQRQGMCFNNAATFVSNHVELLTQVSRPAAEHWAKIVYEYANALYLMGDLGKQSPGSYQEDKLDAEFESMMQKQREAIDPTDELPPENY